MYILLSIITTLMFFIIIHLLTRLKRRVLFGKYEQYSGFLVFFLERGEDKSHYGVVSKIDGKQGIRISYLVDNKIKEYWFGSNEFHVNVRTRKFFIIPGFFKPITFFRIIFKKYFG